MKEDNHGRNTRRQWMHYTTIVSHIQGMTGMFCTQRVKRAHNSSVPNSTYINSFRYGMQRSLSRRNPLAILSPVSATKSWDHLPKPKHTVYCGHWCPIFR